MDNSWMLEPNRRSDKYKDGVKRFIEVQSQNLNGNDKCRCPCRDCLETCFLDLATIGKHLLVRGLSSTFVAQNANPPEGVENEEEDDVIGMFTDAFGPNSFHEQAEQREFYKLFTGLEEELYPGSKKLSSFQFLVKLMHVKVLNRWSNKSFNMLLQLLKDAFPEGSNIPVSHYDAKKKMRDFGLGYELIHACKYDCALFWKEHQNANKCPECNEPRFKYDDAKGKNVPHKVLRYFPLKPRLQRLFMSRHTAADMRWHKEKRLDTDDVLRHPADGLAWKDFDQQYPCFAQDPRNVRLGLASDGFNPFGNMSNSYSMWHVVLMPYNMPPWKCMKEHFFMMTLLIPGPQAPGKDMDVYLRPLVDELKELWEIGVQTWDAYGEENFILHASVLWTINDFPAYGSLSGWSTKGYKACPVCNEDASSEPLRSKICYMGHRRYLPLTHPWRRSRLHNGKHEMRVRPRDFSGDDILQQLNRVKKLKPGKHQNNVDRKRKRTTEELNWTKKSIFFELEYWSKLKLRHILDVMHIEKNITDNVIGTLLSIEGKNKDTDKARLDLADLNIRKELHLKDQGNKWLKPCASYTLAPNERKEFCSFLKSVKFPDGYAANISRNVNIIDGKIFGMKTHDCHVMLQRLLPVGIRPYLPKDVCTALVELSNFFQQLCAKSLVVKDLKKLEEGIVLILCKLERIFPPAFFDVMVHLAVHLPHEAILAGHVNTRWMYPIERNLGTLKGSVKQRARPEGSIAETYIVNEALTFCSMYLRGIDTRFNQEDRNSDTRKEEPKGKISVFSQIARPFGGRNYVQLSRKDLDKIHWYILHNCEEIKPYFDEHMAQLERESPDNLYQRQEKEFPKWFSTHMKNLHSTGSQGATNEIYSLASGPDDRVNKYTGCVVNGVRFHTKERDNHRITQNSGVVVPGEYDDGIIDFYGRLCSVIEVNYIMGYRVIIFECEWFDTNPKKKRIQRDYHLTSINVSNTWFKNDTYVLATQASQVFYLDDYKAGPNWKVAMKVIHRHIWDVTEKDNIEDIVEGSNDVAYQEGESSDVQWVVEEENLDAMQLVRAGDNLDEEINAPTFNVNDEDDDTFIHDISEEEEDDTLEEYYSEGEESLESYDDDSD